MDRKVEDALTALTYGIYVVTAGKGEGSRAGMIASWASRVSHNPPLLMVAIRKGRYSAGVIRQGGSFALHVLAKDHSALVFKFRSRDVEERFRGLMTEEGKTGSPILRECLAFLDCRLEKIVELGDHDLFAGRVIEGERGAGGSPMSGFDLGRAYLGRW